MSLKISNELIGILAVMLVIVAIAGLAPFLIKGITGAGATAQANLTIASVTSCDFVKDKIDFGAVVRGTKNWSEQYTGPNTNWILQNDGNANISTNLSISTQLWSPTYQNTNWMARCNNSGSTVTGGTCNAVYQTLSAIATSQITIATKLRTEGCCDNVSIYNNITIAIDEPTGYHMGAVQYTCYAD